MNFFHRQTEWSFYRKSRNFDLYEGSGVYEQGSNLCILIRICSFTMPHFTRLASISLLLWMHGINETTNTFFGNCNQISRWKDTHASNLIIFRLYLEFMKANIKSAFKINVQCSARCTGAMCVYSEKSGSSNTFSYFWDCKETKLSADYGPRSSILEFDGNYRETSIRHLVHTFLYLLLTTYLFFFLYRSSHIVFILFCADICSWI